MASSFGGTLYAAAVSSRALSVLLAGLFLTHADTSEANILDNLWSTPDQKAAKALEAGDAERAAALFEDSDWRGTAHYEAGDYRSASAEFGKGESADALYNRANALALAGDLQGAIDSYDKSLAIEPEQQDAIANRELVKSLLDQEQQQQENNEQDGDSDQSEEQGDSQESESDSSAQDQQSESDSQEGESESQDQQPSDQDAQPGAEGEMSEDMDMSELEQATEEQMARFNEHWKNNRRLNNGFDACPMIPAVCSGANSAIKQSNA